MYTVYGNNIPIEIIKKFNGVYKEAWLFVTRYAPIHTVNLLGTKFLKTDYDWCKLMN